MSTPNQSRNVALVVATAFFMQMLDGVIIVTALPQMAKTFGVDTLAMSAGVTVYMLAVAIFIPTAGWLGDRLGVRRIFLAAIAVFTIASIACGAAQDLGQFLLARALQGAGGALMAPVGRIIVLRTAKKNEIVQAIGLTVWPALMAPVIGPALGGFLTAYFSWRWNFWVNIPLGIIGFTLIAWIVPRDTEFRDKPFDWIGFAMTSASLAALLYGFEASVHGQLPGAVAVSLVAAGIVLTALTVLWLRRAAHPLLDLSALKVRTFAATETRGGVALRMGINATPFLLPLMFQVGFGLDPLQSGGLVVAYFFGNFGMKSITTPMLRRFGFRDILVVNGSLAGLSIALCGFLGPDTPYSVIVALLVVAGMTRSMEFTSLSTLAFADIEASHRSSASTLSSMFTQVVVTCAIALAAGLLGVSQRLRGDEALALEDFHRGFFVIGALTVAGALYMLRLPRDAGAEISGHRVTQAA